MSEVLRNSRSIDAYCSARVSMGLILSLPPADPLGLWLVASGLTDVAVARGTRCHQVALVVSGDGPAQDVVRHLGLPGADPWDLEPAPAVVLTSVAQQHPGSDSTPRDQSQCRPARL